MIWKFNLINVFVKRLALFSLSFAIFQICPAIRSLLGLNLKGRWASALWLDKTFVIVRYWRCRQRDGLMDVELNAPFCRKQWSARLILRRARNSRKSLEPVKRQRVLQSRSKQAGPALGEVIGLFDLVNRQCKRLETCWRTFLICWSPWWHVHTA